jgi:hypothetical protein
MWPFNYLNKKTKPYFNLEETLGPDPMKDNNLMTEMLKSTNQEIEVTIENQLDQAVAEVNNAVPIDIINSYADWTETTVINLTNSRTILAERIARDHEELRQIDKVIEGMNLMRDTIVSEEPSFQTSELPTKSIRNRKSVELAK